MELPELIEIVLPLLICVAVCLVLFCIAVSIVCVTVKNSLSELRSRVEQLEEGAPKTPFGDFTEQGGKP